MFLTLEKRQRNILFAYDFEFVVVFAPTMLGPLFMFFIAMAYSCIVNIIEYRSVFLFSLSIFSGGVQR